jgi:Queuine tRNA-ribosyltransferase
MFSARDRNKILKILIITSCTGEKVVSDPKQITLKDFRKGRDQIRSREAALKEKLTRADEIYSGMQHVRLMRGVSDARKAGVDLDLQILSAGYGVIPANRRIAPYEATFQGMPKGELRKWAHALGVPEAFRKAVATPCDLCLVLLGDDYLAACALDGTIRFGGPTLLFCGNNTLKKLPKLGNLHAIALTNAEAKRFSCGLVGLKGELASRILTRIAASPAFASTLAASSTVLSLIEEPPAAALGRRSAARAKTDVDFVVSLPANWHSKPHRKKLSYFIPEWDDLVDRDYDFQNDIHSGGTGNWANEVYAHQMYPEPNYDGILISKVVAEKSRSKKERINRLGVHRLLRVPREFPIMGDCGAFGYIHEKVPPYATEEILDYYTRLDFDYGVSIDHLIVTATESEKKTRYELTIDNAAEFLKKHRKAKLPWTPIGAVQGWDPKSYAVAAKKCVAMGYEYIGLGGLVRSSTKDILEVLHHVHQVVPANVNVHLFGLARLASMRVFADLGVRSVDSASLLRRAWMGTGQNYLSMEGQFYTAIRIPEAGKSFRAKRMVSEGRASGPKVEKLEARCMEAMTGFDANQIPVDAVLDVLEEYDHLITPDRAPTRELLRETLEARPWRSCSCDICRRDGIQVLIFRGNNRNRRRGFHNTYVFYRLMQKALAGETVGFLRSGIGPAKKQLPLFGIAEMGEKESADAI